MKLAKSPLWAMIIIGLGLAACVPEMQPSMVTGKGNGGNGLAMSKAEVEKRIKDIKPSLVKVFEALKFLAEAESKLPGSTDLSEFPKVRKLIGKMVVPRAGKSIFEDIQTKNNLDIVDEPCVDFQGFENVGAAKAGQIGGPVCFSVSELRKISPKGADASVDIQILSLGAHEFGHHFLNSDKPEEDEGLLRTLQAFVNYQLHKFEDMPSEGMISTREESFLDRFHNFSKKLLEKIEAAADIRG